ncbi:transglycosylase family protein [Streptomyces sp. NPDC102467]|uniref:LysM peptidoglycan-binding domain-containing protein n=1 Tax=Streptomyces sp. NPDC102467 TaxID=3366179 RepID=UPI0038254A91
MLSGNGRHRRPRQAPALVVAAGVTGSVIAIPLLAATSASAASTTTWDKLAECESGGQWSLNAGTGYFGGLQFSQEMWEQYGGLDYAPSADEASRSQQIAVAEQALKAKGPSAWPSCSLVAGLTQGDESADVDPGATVSPQASDPADPSVGVGLGVSDEPSAEASGDTSGNTASGDPSGDSSDEPSGDASGKASGKAGDKAGDSASDDASDDAAGKDGGGSDKSGRADDPTSSATPSPSGSASGDSASDESGADSAGRHRGDPAADDTSDSRTGDGRHASREEDRTEEAYTVRSGDSLWDIADAQDVRGGWDALYDLNKKTVGSDPDLILPGQSLDLGLETVEK